MKLVTPLIALAMAIGAVVLPGSMPKAEAAAAPAATSVVVTVAAQGVGVAQPGTPLELDGTIENPTTTTIAAGTATVYLSGATLTDRDELTDWLGESSTSAEGVGGAVFTFPIAEVPAGRTVAFSTSVPAGSFDLGTQYGARRLAVGVVGSGGIAYGRSVVVWNPGGAVNQTALAIAAPLTVPRATTGLISSELLATYTSPNGLLTRDLDQIIDRNVTIAVDPMIVASIRLLGNSVPDSARLWLERLEAATNDTFELTYADSDLSAATQAGASGVLAPTSFPIDADLFPGATTASPTPTATDDVQPSPTPSASSALTLPTIDTLTQLPYSMTSIAWPASDTVVDNDLDVFGAAGLSDTILDSSNVSVARASGGSDTAAATVTVDKHLALVSDTAIATLINSAASASTQLEWEQAMAEVSATLSLIGNESAGTTPTLLAALARDTPGSRPRLSQTLDALYSLQWVSSSDVRALRQDTPVTATLTPTPESADRVAKVAALLAAEAKVAEFGSVLVDPSQLGGERRLSLLAILSNEWPPTSTAWKNAADKYLAKSDALMASVRIAGSSSLYITSKNSHVDVTVQNELDFPVTVYVTVRSPNGILTILNPRLAQTVQANSQAKASVPVQSVANGDVTVRVSLTSATGIPIATTALVKVDVQAGWETAFTAVIAALLVALFGVGIYRNIARRRRSRRAADETDTAETDTDATDTDETDTSADSPADDDSADATSTHEASPTRPEQAEDDPRP
jgi:hypothetical protein